MMKSIKNNYVMNPIPNEKKMNTFDSLTPVDPSNKVSNKVSNNFQTQKTVTINKDWIYWSIIIVNTILIIFAIIIYFLYTNNNINEPKWVLIIKGILYSIIAVNTFYQMKFERTAVRPEIIIK